MPSLKWSSVLPRKSRSWSSGIHCPPVRFRLEPFSVTSSGESSSESPSPKSSANLSSLLTASTLPCAAGHSCKSLRTTLPATFRIGTRIRTVGRTNPWSRGRSSSTMTRVAFFPLRFAIKAAFFASHAAFLASAFTALPSLPSALALVSASVAASRSIAFAASISISFALDRFSSASLFFVIRFL